MQGTAHYFGRKPSLILLTGPLAAGALAALLLGLSGCANEGPNPAPSGHQHAADDPQAHHETSSAPSKLIVSTRPAQVTAGEPAQLRLMIHRDDGSMVDRFETVHEKQVHLILVRDGLDHFAHIHPEVDPDGNITAEFTFPAGGRYLLYADHKPAGEPQGVATAEVRVGGDAPPAPELVPDVPGEVSGDGVTADVSVSPSGGETRIAFALRDEAGEPVTDLEPYLGAMGHLVVLSADGREYVHAHPLEAEGTAAGPVRFAAHMTKPGLYKGWGQFQRSGKVLTVPLVLKVE